MCVTAIANLLQTCQKENDQRMLFHKDKDIIPFIECHWESMTTMPRRVTLSWHATVSISLRTHLSRIIKKIIVYISQLRLQIHKALLKDVGTLFTIDENNGDGQIFGLIAADLVSIKPNYEAMIKGGHLKVTEMGLQHVGTYCDKLIIMSISYTTFSQYKI